ncbi:MBL fold metallo-hydrolase [Alkalihalophilus lindianensis]|uniref:MBL fold metallo-hydrolase n=1 Tax=Alkalihalophilus lindianensis TaxID=1630542 RepID=A0ABU3X6M0_9BACI|nr:MBL fold metallo-hydrolase [Alkalihalophilus lindianensis]MDV2683535.1 MBL fold metallo-hydrolase [Alkalihalophilus lindianensis]
MSKPISLSPRLSLIDGYDMDMPERTGSYILHEDKLTIVETGPSPSIKHILNGFIELGLKIEDVEYIIVTHIHLDHAGGVGLLLEHCPKATVIVHPKGFRHLNDPSRLIHGAKAVYQHDFDRLFDPILPVADERLLSMEDGDTLTLSKTCTLTFLHTPGHAAHHFSIYDSASNGIFTGDTLGVRYEPLAKEGIEFILPSTSPNQFDPQATNESMKRIQRLNVEQIYFGHFSASTHPEVVYNHINKWLPIFVEKGQVIIQQNKGVSELSALLLELVQQELDEKGVSRDHLAYQHIRLDLQVCSMGIIDYLNK